MFPEDEIVLISAIEHFSYCPRQCALIHLEQIFHENVFTLRGRRAHEKAHMESAVHRGATHMERGLPLWSDRLGLVGKSDVVEFEVGKPPYPVEYKHGLRRQRLHDDLQLCAQALCLEEMLGLQVPAGAIYYHSTHRRREVNFTPELRYRTEKTVDMIRQLLQSGHTPPPVNDARCPRCSLADACVPSVLAEARLNWHLRDLYCAEPAGQSEEAIA